MIFLSPTVYSSTLRSLAIRTHQVTGEYDCAARIQESKLLDGTTDFAHHGTTDSDRVLKIDCRLSESDQAALIAFHNAAILLRLSYWGGVYTVYIKRIRTSRDGVTRIEFNLVQKLTS